MRDALRRWGVEAFNKLFGDRRGGEISYAREFVRK